TSSSGAVPTSARASSAVACSSSSALYAPRPHQGVPRLVVPAAGEPLVTGHRITLDQPGERLEHRGQLRISLAQRGADPAQPPSVAHGDPHQAPPRPCCSVSNKNIVSRYKCSLIILLNVNR